MISIKYQFSLATVYEGDILLEFRIFEVYNIARMYHNPCLLNLYPDIFSKTDVLVRFFLHLCIAQTKNVKEIGFKQLKINGFKYSLMVIHFN